MLRLLFGLILLSFLGTCDRAPKNAAPLPLLGTAAQPLRYDRFAEIETLFGQRNDTTYLVNFWATWCKPCREELPLLQRLVGERADQPLRVVLVSLDTQEDAIARIPTFLEEAAPDLPAIILTDEDPAWGKTLDRVWSGSLPTTILYRGDLRYVFRRAFSSYPDLNVAVEPLLGR
ncbi:MAG: TlpA disulfide reductase family protein [Bacteroidota bacterium]